MTDRIGRQTLERIADTLGNYNRWMFDLIAPHVSGEVLEIGAGIGNLSAFFIDRPSVYLTDVEASYLEVLRARFADRPHVEVGVWDLGQPIPAALSSRRFETIVCLNVLEHIRDDRLALERMRALLKPNGHLVLLVPAHPCLYSSLDENLLHHRRYAVRSLKQLLGETHFKLVSSCYFNRLGALGWWLNGRLLRKTILPTGQMSLFDRLVPLLRLERFVPIPFGISIIAVAQNEARDST